MWQTDQRSRKCVLSHARESVLGQRIERERWKLLEMESIIVSCRFFQIFCIFLGFIRRINQKNVNQVSHQNTDLVYANMTDLCRPVLTPSKDRLWLRHDNKHKREVFRRKNEVHVTRSLILSSRDLSAYPPSLTRLDYGEVYMPLNVLGVHPYSALNSLLK